MPIATAPDSTGPIASMCVRRNARADATSAVVAGLEMVARSAKGGLGSIEHDAPVVALHDALADEVEGGPGAGGVEGVEEEAGVAGGVRPVVVSELNALDGSGRGRQSGHRGGGP